MLKLIKSLFTKKHDLMYVSGLRSIMDNEGMREREIVLHFINIDHDFYRKNRHNFYMRITSAINHLLETNYIDYDFKKAIYYQIPQAKNPKKLTIELWSFLKSPLGSNPLTPPGFDLQMYRFVGADFTLYKK